MSIEELVKKHGKIAILEDPQYLKILDSILKPLGYSVNFYDGGYLEVMGNNFSYFESINERGESTGEYAYSIKNEDNFSSNWIKRFSRILKDVNFIKVGKAQYRIPEDKEEVFLREVKKRVEKEPFIDEKGSFQSDLPRDVVDKFKEKLEVLI